MSAADAAFARALEHWRAESLREAHAACLKALGHDAGHVAAAVLASEILLRVGEAGRAVALLADVVRRSPGESAARVLLARAQRIAGELTAAERSAAAARRLSPGSGEAAAEHALALIALGRHDEAAAALGEAAAAAGEDPHAHWVVADTLLRLGRRTRSADGGDRDSREDRDDRLARARAAFAQAVALDPAAADWHAAEALRATSANRPDEARGLIDRGRQLMPQDPQLAHMAAAVAGATPDRASDAYLAAHFDAFADSFDDVLVGRLGYRLPELVCEALERHVAGAPLDAVLDAGCGTGLCAARLRPIARRLVGVDLSEQMVIRARELRLYDELAVADLVTWLAQDERAGSFEAIVAADVLVYFGDLRAPLAAAAGALVPGGVLVFSTERAEHDTGYALEPSGRFSHDPRYVARVAAEAGLEQLECSEISYRKEGGEPVGSTIVCLRLAAPRRSGAMR